MHFIFEVRIKPGYTAEQYASAWVAASDLRVLREIKLVEPPAVADVHVTAGSGYVWAVLGDGTLTRIDPRTAKVTRSAWMPAPPLGSEPAMVSATGRTRRG
jgi:hypothetical protein